MLHSGREWTSCSPPSTQTKDSRLKGPDQIPVVPTVSRGEICLRGTILYFFWKQESCLKSPSLRVFRGRIKIARCIEACLTTASASATALLSQSPLLAVQPNQAQCLYPSLDTTHKPQRHTKLKISCKHNLERSEESVIM